ncbi:hypothetical protein N2152v2_005996 [Parachlorella kessleri]
MQPLKAVVAEALTLSKLEDVAPESCKLLFNKKEQDLATPIRFAGLPASAKLELVTGREPKLGVQEAARLPVPTAAPASAQAAAAPTSGAAAALAQPAPAPGQQHTGQPAAAPATGPLTMPAPALAPLGAGGHSQTAAASVGQPAVPSTGAPAGAHGPGVPPDEANAGTARPGPHQQQPVEHQREPQQQQQQHASVAVFGQEVHVFTREAELALESSHMALSDRAPDESFYEFGEGDLQKAMAGFSRARAEAESSHLMTKQMRANEEARRAAAYGPVTIRVSLPDGHVLQATFQASHPLSKLRGVVRRAVVEGLGDRLSLYTTPPKVLLKDMDTNFYQAKLIPAARVHVGIQGQPASPQGAPLLRPEVLQLVGPPPDKAAALQRRGSAAGAPVGGGGDKRRNGGEGAAGAGGGSRGEGGAGGAGQGTRLGGSGSPGAVRLPKWMKIGK